MLCQTFFKKEKNKGKKKSTDQGWTPFTAEGLITPDPPLVRPDQPSPLKVQNHL